MSRKRLSKRDRPKVNQELEGFDIKIDSFGEIKSTLDIDKINKFLNRNVDDKKLRDRDDLDKGQVKDEEKADEPRKNFEE
ncbi:MAG: hypothetical protein ACOC30_02030 [Marinilabilia sp.]